MQEGVGVGSQVLVFKPLLVHEKHKVLGYSEVKYGTVVDKTWDDEEIKRCVVPFKRHGEWCVDRVGTVAEQATIGDRPIQKVKNLKINTKTQIQKVNLQKLFFLFLYVIFIKCFCV